MFGWLGTKSREFVSIITSSHRHHNYFRLDRFAALKILTCESTKASLPGNEQRSDELRILEKIAAAQLMHRGFKHNLALYDSFEFSGPHGVHRCLVTEVLGFSLDHLRKLNDDGDYRLKAGFIKRVVKQILYGLEYLHDVCGVIHAGESLFHVL